jgi:Spy/CpxP family protein refolding chaperone
MNRWMRKTMTFASLAGTLALVPGAFAYAQESRKPAQDQPNEHHGHRGGLLGAALKLDSLTAEQRTTIEQLVQQRRTASGPVRQADAQALTVLAQQVEQARIDPQALAPSLNAEQSAAAAETVVDRDTLNKLHSVLTPAQRGQLVDRIEAAHTQHGQKREGEGDRGRFGRGLGLTAQQESEIRANLRAEPSASSSTPPKGQRGAILEAFRGESFDASGFVVGHSPGAHVERLAMAMVPVLSPAQRATFASHLRMRASRESGAKGA